MHVVVGSDHGGAQLKHELIEYIKQLYPNVTISSKGSESSTDSQDYPNVARQVCLEVLSLPNEKSFGVLVCGSGIGMSIAANKINGIRCALVHEGYSAKMARRHNDANVIALGQRVTGSGVAKEALAIFLNEEFEGGRHCTRVAILSELEKLFN